MHIADVYISRGSIGKECTKEAQEDGYRERCPCSVLYREAPPCQITAFG